MTTDDTTLSFTLDGVPTSVEVDLGRPLVDVLRDDLGKTGTHVGCRNGACGACTVLVDGEAFKSCLLPCARVDGRGVQTIQGVAKDGALSPLQQAFWDHNAFQCGFCMAGHVLCAEVLLRETDGTLTGEDIDTALAGNLCRCTGYQQIRRAIVASARPGAG